jgi:DNA-directed RNA polymerase subunit F
MVNPRFIEQKSISLLDAKEAIEAIEKRDKELNYLSNKTKEYLDQFVTLNRARKTKLEKKLQDLNLTRLKEEHITKICDFLPKTVDELKVVLQAYPLSMPKKDHEEIVKTVKALIKE